MWCIFTELSHWADSVSKSRCLYVVCRLFVPFCFLTSYYSHSQKLKVQSTNSGGRTIVWDLTIFAPLWSRIAAEIFFFSLCHSLLMDIGHNQQQHTTVHSGEVRRGRVRGCGCCVGVSDLWQVKRDTWYLKCDTWKVTPETWHKTPNLFSLIFASGTIRKHWDIQCLPYRAFFI